jgi:hypothetical protein
MATVIFISEQRLKSLTALHTNVEPQDLMPAVQQSQDIYVQELLGTTFYNGLRSRVLAGTTTAAEQTLLNDYIGPMLANFALYMAIPTLSYKIFNKSILQPTSEESQPATLEQIQWVRDQVFSTAQFYRERSREFLCNNDTDYPEYINPSTLDGMLPDKQRSYYGGLVIPKYRGCGYYNEANSNGPQSSPTP